MGKIVTYNAVVSVSERQTCNTDGFSMDQEDMSISYSCTIGDKSVLCILRLSETDSSYRLPIMKDWLMGILKQQSSGHISEKTGLMPFVVIEPDELVTLSVGIGEGIAGFGSENLSSEERAVNRQLALKMWRELQEFKCAHQGTTLMLEQVLRELLEEIAGEEGAVLSDVLIAYDKFYFPQYGKDVSITSRQARVLYTLYVRHPEGIVRKQLGDYKDELLTIYRYFAPNSSTDRLHKMVEGMCQMRADNVVADKLMTLIRRAFRESLGKETAELYMPHGEKGGRMSFNHAQIMYLLPEELQTDKLSAVLPV